MSENNYNNKERRYGRPAPEGERRYGKPAPEGERRYGKPAPEGEHRYGKPAPEGERRYGRPAPEGERRYGKSAPEGERRYGRPAPQGEKPVYRNENGEPLPRKERPHEDRRWFKNRPQQGKPTGRIKPVASREDVARMLALMALQDVFREDAYASLALNRRLRESAASPDDKKLATFIFYAAVENRLLITYILNQFIERTPDPVVEDVLHIAIAQLMFMDRIPEHAAVDEAVKMTRRLGRDEQAGFVNGVLRSLLRKKEAGEIRMPDAIEQPVRRMSIKYSVPEPLVKRLADCYGEEFAEAMLAYKPDERLESVRPNWMKMNAEEFKAFAEKKGWDVRKGNVPGVLLVHGAGDLAGDPDYRQGKYSIQGAASMLAAEAVGAKPGMQILDACAAPGGKSCLMAERMMGSGRVQAWDVHAHRVELIKAAAGRLNLDNVRPAVRDATVFKSDMEFMMDAVLVDAPCSGLGVMINKPDVKYRYKDEQIEELVQLQRKILHACARYVKVGGTLVYSTCTVLPEENAMQVEHFLKTHGDFVIDDDPSFLPEELRGYWHDGMIQLQAHRDGSEGFFIAKLKRV